MLGAAEEEGFLHFWYTNLLSFCDNTQKTPNKFFLQTFSSHFSSFSSATTKWVSFINKI